MLGIFVTFVVRLACFIESSIFVAFGFSETVHEATKRLLSQNSPHIDVRNSRCFICNFCTSLGWTFLFMSYRKGFDSGSVRFCILLELPWPGFFSSWTMTTCLNSNGSFTDYFPPKKRNHYICTMRFLTAETWHDPRYWSYLGPAASVPEMRPLVARCLNSNGSFWRSHWLLRLSGLPLQPVSVARFFRWDIFFISLKNSAKSIAHSANKNNYLFIL